MWGHSFITFNFPSLTWPPQAQVLSHVILLLARISWPLLLHVIHSIWGVTRRSYNYIRPIQVPFTSAKITWILNFRIIFAAFFFSRSLSPLFSQQSVGCVGAAIEPPFAFLQPDNHPKTRSNKLATNKQTLREADKQTREAQASRRKQAPHP